MMRFIDDPRRPTLWTGVVLSVGALLMAAVSHRLYWYYCVVGAVQLLATFPVIQQAVVTFVIVAGYAGVLTLTYLRQRHLIAFIPEAKGGVVLLVGHIALVVYLIAKFPNATEMTALIIATVVVALAYMYRKGLYGMDNRFMTCAVYPQMVTRP